MDTDINTMDLSDAERLARNGPVWFTTCAVDEGEFTMFGPFFSYEDAEAECWPDGPDVPCSVQKKRGGAHLVGRTVGITVCNAVLFRKGTHPWHNSAGAAWRALPTNQRAGVIDLASLLRISAT